MMLKYMTNLVHKFHSIVDWDLNLNHQYGNKIEDNKTEKRHTFQFYGMNDNRPFSKNNPLPL